MARTPKFLIRWSDQFDNQFTRSTGARSVPAAIRAAKKMATKIQKGRDASDDAWEKEQPTFHATRIRSSWAVFRTAVPFDRINPDRNLLLVAHGKLIEDDQAA